MNFHSEDKSHREGDKGKLNTYIFFILYYKIDVLILLFKGENKRTEQSETVGVMELEGRMFS